MRRPWLQENKVRTQEPQFHDGQSQGLSSAPHSGLWSSCFPSFGFGVTPESVRSQLPAQCLGVTPARAWRQRGARDGTHTRHKTRSPTGGAPSQPPFISSCVAFRDIASSLCGFAPVQHHQVTNAPLYVLFQWAPRILSMSETDVSLKHCSLRSRSIVLGHLAITGNYSLCGAQGTCSTSY